MVRPRVSLIQYGPPILMGRYHLSICSLGAHYERDVSSILANSNYVSILRDEEIVLLTRQ